MRTSTVLTLVGLALVPASLDAAEIGETLYLEHCSVCHQPDGTGVPGLFPPLAGNPSVAADGEEEVMHFLRTVIFGFHGGLIVDNQVYSGRMPPIGYRGRVNDSELLELINYQRTAWGNAGRPVTFSELAKARAEGEK